MTAESMTFHRQEPARFTTAEFLQLIQQPPVSEWLGKIELVDGVIVRMSPANIPHWQAQRIVFLRLHSALGDAGNEWAGNEWAGSEWVVGQEPTVRLTGDTIRVPDVAVLRSPDLSAAIFDRAALFLVVEVADTSLAFDLGEKLGDYAEAFVPHYWVVDLAQRRTLVMADPRGGRYETRRPVPFGEAITLPGTGATIVID